MDVGLMISRDNVLWIIAGEYSANHSYKTGIPALEKEKFEAWPRASARAADCSSCQFIQAFIPRCQMRHLRSLLESCPILGRIPDQGLIASDVGVDLTHAQATRGADGSYAWVLYVPTGERSLSTPLSGSWEALWAFEAGDAMDTLTDGSVIVQYSGDNRELAEELCRLALQSHAVLCELFDVPPEVHLHIYWADRMDWETIPACRHKGSYGMPHMRCGEDHTHYVILPAANIDVSQRLMETVCPVLDRNSPVHHPRSERRCPARHAGQKSPTPVHRCFLRTGGP
jgi:hypothetical protein